NYFTRSHDSRILKSSTMYFNDENGHQDGIFAINYDITTLFAAESNLKSLISTAEPEQDKDPEYIPQDVNELLVDLIHE
ncbi:PAS domain-containing protein, partial [Enterococcus faecalis]|uniref:PAS domain-containing protein n=1 Tax=Enterococcus faecalis TaxID=1351 RepID=UPI003D6A3940